MTRALKNLVALAISLAISLAIGELAARYVLRDITTTSDNRSYFALKWKEANVRLNGYGYRDREFPMDKTAGTYRIAFIGDSFTFGQGIPENARMSNLVQDELRKHRPTAEVLNFGNAGNNTADEARVLRMVLNDFEPDFVILQWFVNDVEIPPLPNHNRPNLAGGTLTALKKTMQNRSVLYFLAVEVWHRFLDGTSAGYSSDMLRRFGNPDDEAPRRAHGALLEFVRTAKAHLVPMAVVLVPQLAPTPESGYTFAYLHQRVLATCRSEQLICIDLFEIFSPYLATPGGAKSLWVNRFDTHMGAEANRLATAELMRVLGPLWMPAEL